MFSTTVIRRCIVKRVQAVSVTLAILLVLPCLVFAYGDGAATGAVKNGLDSGKVCRCETLDEVRQGQRWHTRPEAMRKSPYEAASRFWDAEQSLLLGYKHGNYTKEEMIEIFQWLKTNKLFISDKALIFFDGLTGTSATTTVSSTTTPTTPTTPLSKVPIYTRWKAMLKRAKQMYLEHPNRSRTAIAHNLYKEMHTPEEQAKHSLISTAYQVDLIDVYLKRAEQNKLLPPKAERDISKLGK
jgi:hypothetical protein